ncbi:MAG: TIGR00266 family protein [Actinomycetales bacterium]|nr:TIGR00266 family protein [Actinomycetales bacterium]
MRVELRHSPAAAVARLHLSAGEEIRAESGAMMATSAGVTISAQMRGGFLKALSRSVLGGESFFLTTFAADPSRPSWVDVAPQLAGDIVVLNVTDGTPLVLTRGTWLANEASVEIDAKWGGGKMLFGGEGGFVVRASGTGQVVCSAYGAIDAVQLGAGESMTLDTGHLVAYTDGLAVSVRKATSTVTGMFTSGEGLVMDITGPGTVWTQSRNPSALVNWITAMLPKQSSGGGGFNLNS